MDAHTGGGVFLFEGFRLDRQARALFRRDDAGEFVPIVATSKASRRSGGLRSLLTVIKNSRT